MADPFAEAVDAIFGGDLAVTETYTPKGGAPRQVRVSYQRGVVTEIPGLSVRNVERTTLAHLLLSEVGVPKAGSTITDGSATRTVDIVVEQDEHVVVVKVR